MPWVRIDDGFFNHRKVLELSNNAKLGFIAGLCHCNSQLTDGFISAGAARSILGGLGLPAKVSKELVDAGFWHKRADGFDVHEFLEYQPRADVVKEERAKAKERMQRFRSAKRSGSVRPEQQANFGRSSEPVHPPGSATPVSRIPFSFSSFCDARPALPGAIETENERAKATALAERAHEILAGAGSTPDPDQVLDLVWWAAAHVDLTVVDEALGYCSGLDKPPRQISYLAKTIRSWAAQRDVDMPAFNGGPTS